MILKQGEKRKNWNKIPEADFTMLFFLVHLACFHRGTIPPRRILPLDWPGLQEQFGSKTPQWMACWSPLLWLFPYGLTVAGESWPLSAVSPFPIQPDAFLRSVPELPSHLREAKSWPSWPPPRTRPGSQLRILLKPLRSRSSWQTEIHFRIKKKTEKTNRRTLFGTSQTTLLG